MGTDSSSKAVKDFLAEAEEIIDQLNNDLIALSDAAERGDDNPDLVNAIFRGAHSLKGLAGMFGFARIGELAHVMESLLDFLRLGRVNLNGETLALLFDSIEALGALVRAAGADDDQVDIAPIMVRLNAFLGGGAADDGQSVLARLGIPNNILNALTEYEEHRLLENVKKGRSIYSVLASFSLMTFDKDLGALTELLKKSGEVISTLPSAAANMEAGINFQLLFGSELALAPLSQLVDQQGVSISLLGSPAGETAPPTRPQAPAASMPAGGTPTTPQPVVAPVPPPATPAAAASPPPQLEAVAPSAGDETVTAKSMSRTVRVDIGKLDELMNIVGELVLSHTSINALVTRLRAEGFSPLAVELGKAAKVLERKLAELQKGVMEIRMIPVGQLFEKMSRIVRKVSREQGKKVELQTFGADTELDKLIVEDISDPLMHIIRNAIDHGIETPEGRLAAGKAEKGLIRLSSYQKGNHVVIEVQDDGRGIDLDRVKRKALERGLIPSLEGLPDREALDLIFLPGFSTSEQVSDISGRGVGMDVVKNNIAALSGMVDIVSEKGAGSRIIITLPITLAIIKALIMSTRGQVFAIPITSVLETLALDDGDIQTVERKEVMQLREATLPLLRLDRFFALERGEPASAGYVVVVGLAEKRIGLIVDDLVGQQDIVIKSIGDVLCGVRGVSGAADLGDQRTILVLDVGGIVSEATRS